LIAAAPDDDYPSPVGAKLMADLIEYGANVKAADNNGMTALIVTTLYSNSEVVKALVGAGANVVHAEPKSGI
jgi:Ankyrin repeat.